MEQAERCDTTIYRPTVFDSVQPSESRGRSIVQRMSSLSVRRSVTFDKRITVFRFSDWPPEIYRAARKGPWIQLAIDRQRFERRIQQTELALGNIFTNNHRNKMWLHINNKLCV